MLWIFDRSVELKNLNFNKAELLAKKFSNRKATGFIGNTEPACKPSFEIIWV
jgi:hypothetical protein